VHRSVVSKFRPEYRPRVAQYVGVKVGELLACYVTFMKGILRADRSISGAGPKGLAELDALYCSLEEQEASLLRLLEHIAEEKRRVNIQRATYAPVYSVPDDVLYLILEEAFAHDRQGCALDYHCDTPLAISRVSRRWRYVALSLPRIWSCIHVPVPLSRAHFPLLTLYITRSQPLPISFTMRCRFYKASSPEMRLYINCLALFTKARIRSCTICTDYRDSMETLIGFLSTANKSCYEYLRLQVVGEENHLVMDGECLATTLQCLSLHAVRLPSPPIALQNLRQIFLECQPISIRYLHEIAIACPELSKFTVREVTTSSQGAPLAARFPSLRHLHLLEIHLSGIRDLLSWIEAPRLDTLVIRDISLGVQAAQGMPIPRFKTYPALRHVSIRFPHAAAYIQEFVSNTPNAVALDVSGTNIGPLLRSLLIPSERAVLLPKLQKLTATILWNERHDVFLDVVRHRKQIGYPLREICLGHLLLAEMDEQLLRSLSEYVTVIRLSEGTRCDIRGVY
jgi:hypothetical protein